jgi:hypothetical protein
VSYNHGFAVKRVDITNKHGGIWNNVWGYCLRINHGRQEKKASLQQETALGRMSHEVIGSHAVWPVGVEVSLLALCLPWRMTVDVKPAGVLWWNQWHSAMAVIWRRRLGRTWLVYYRCHRIWVVLPLPLSESISWIGWNVFVLAGIANLSLGSFSIHNGLWFTIKLWILNINIGISNHRYNFLPMSEIYQNWGQNWVFCPQQIGCINPYSRNCFQIITFIIPIIWTISHT